MTRNDKIIFSGTETKLNINIQPIDNVTMDNYDFIVDIYCNSNGNVLSFKKSELVRVDESNYFAKVDTSKLDIGVIKVRVEAYIPDADFDDKLRTEVMCINTGISIKKPNYIERPWGASV